QRLNPLARLAAEIRHDLDTHRSRAVLLHGSDHDAAIAAAEVVNNVVGGHMTRFEHPFNEMLRSGNLGAEILRGAELLSRGRQSKQGNDESWTKNPHGLIERLDFRWRPVSQTSILQYGR